jgi:hypothetical protein
MPAKLDYLEDRIAIRVSTHRADRAGRVSRTCNVFNYELLPERSGHAFGEKLGTAVLWCFKTPSIKL